jgi:hypothetical protein
LVRAIRDNGLDEAGLEHCKPRIREPGIKPIKLNWFRRSPHRDAILSLRSLKAALAGPVTAPGLLEMTSFRLRYR